MAPIALLHHVGHEVAGAVRFLTPEDVFVDKELNEHVCLRLLSLSGVPTAPSQRSIARLFDSAVPGASREQVAWSFARGVLANWLLAGTDAHAKNYSLLHASGQMRVAPLYDVISWLPYRERRPRLSWRPDEGDRTRVKLPMAINAKHDGLAVTAADWRVVADGLGLDGDRVIAEGVRLADALSETGQTSNRSSIITLSHAATKSRTNFSFASSLA